ncbi:hypothetical protein B0T25DRAFT_618695, partial [Lasiosphaeria hispida]
NTSTTFPIKHLCPSWHLCTFLRHTNSAILGAMARIKMVAKHSEPTSVVSGPKTPDNPAAKEPAAEAEDTITLINGSFGHIDTSTLTSLPESIPFAWRCCQCSQQQLLRQPGPHAIQRPDATTFPSATTADTACLNKACPHPRCHLCPLLNLYDVPLATTGGQNLRPDRLHPAGWECCRCREHHYPTARYRPGASIALRHGSSVLAARCTDHAPCRSCYVLNRYGERLGRLNTDSIILEPDAGPLRDNVIFAMELFKFKVAELQREQLASSGNEEEKGLRLLALAGEVLAADDEHKAARAAVEKVKEWVREVRGG